MDDQVTEYLVRRLTDIQKRHNFDPEAGAAQVKELSPATIRDFGAFQELRHMAEMLGVEVKIPYDPFGLKPEENHVPLESRPTYVYFTRLVTEPDVWKIGFSANPHEREGSIQTHNAGHVDLAFSIPCPGRSEARELERRLHRHFRKAKTRNRNDSLKGEWFRLPLSEVKDTIQRIKQEGAEWLPRVK
jgi:hypothetical protein